MATNTNNGSGGHQNHLSPSSSLDGSPSPHTYYYTPDWGLRDDDEEWNSVPLPVLLAVFLGVILLLRFFCTRGVRTDMEEQDAGGVDHGTAVHQLHSHETGGGWVGGRSPSSTVSGGAAVEMAPPLVCTYRKADDGLGELDSCGVCLADLADGEAVRVLPACMHYFHAIGEWLRDHGTCPLCRALLVASGGAT